MLIQQLFVPRLKCMLRRLHLNQSEALTVALGKCMFSHVSLNVLCHGRLVLPTLVEECKNKCLAYSCGSILGHNCMHRHVFGVSGGCACHGNCYSFTSTLIRCIAQLQAASFLAVSFFCCHGSLVRTCYPLQSHVVRKAGAPTVIGSMGWVEFIAKRVFCRRCQQSCGWSVCSCQMSSGEVSQTCWSWTSKAWFLRLVQKGSRCSSDTRYNETKTPFDGTLVSKTRH